MRNEDDLVADYIRKHGVKQCPPRAAAELGESSPGWRRSLERRAEKTSNNKVQQRHQRKLAQRYIADAPTATDPPKARLPSDKQIRYAKYLANKNRISLPEGYDTSRRICSEFITFAIRIAENSSDYTDDHIKRIEKGGPLKHDPGPWDEEFEG